METFTARLASFDTVIYPPRRTSGTKSAKPIRWPYSRPTPAQLAQAGFYYNPYETNPDNTTCFHCNRALDGWEEDDDPTTEHLKHSSDCGWAIMMDILRRSNDPDEIEDPTSDKIVEARQATFSGIWPHDGKRGWVCQSAKMVEGGWYFCPSEEGDDLASCAYCNLSLDGWEPKDNPFDEHYRRSSNCAFFVFAQPPNKRAKNSRSKKARTSKISRLSTQPTTSVVQETPALDTDDGMDQSVMSQPTTKSRSTKASTKSKSKRTKKADTVDVDSQMDIDTADSKPEPPKPKRTNRKRKVGSEEANEYEQNEVDAGNLSRTDPPVKDLSDAEPKSEDTTKRASEKRPLAKKGRLSNDTFEEPGEAREPEEIDDAGKYQAENGFDLHESRESKSRESKSRESRSPEGKPRESKSRENKPRESKSQESKSPENNSRESKSRESKSRESKPQESKSRESKSPDNKSRERRSREDRPQEIEFQKNKSRESESRERRSREDRPRGIEFQKNKSRESESRERRSREDRPGGIEFQKNKSRESESRERRSREDRPQEIEFQENKSRQSNIDIPGPREIAQETEEQSPREEDPRREHAHRRVSKVPPKTSERYSDLPKEQHYAEFVAERRVSNASKEREQDDTLADREGTVSPLPPGSSPSLSVQSSDAENHPPSAMASRLPVPRTPVLSPTKQQTGQIAMTVGTPSPSKRPINPEYLQTCDPWVPVDIDRIIFGDSSDKENDDVGGTNRELTSPEKRMAIDEWIFWNAKNGEDKLKQECERLVGHFEREGDRAMRVLEGIECVD